MNNKFIWFINKNQLQWNRGKWKLSLNVTHLVSHGFHVLSKSLNFTASSYKFQSMIMNRRFVILRKQTKQRSHCVLQSIFCQLLNFFLQETSAAVQDLWRRTLLYTSRRKLSLQLRLQASSNCDNYDSCKHDSLNFNY